MLLLLFAIIMAVTGPEPGDSSLSERGGSLPKYLFFNVFHGGRAYGGAPDRVDAIARWVRQDEGFAVAAFSELNGFDESTWGAFCRNSLGLNHTIFLHTQHGYHLGIASEFPLEKVYASTKAPWHHGMIYVWVEALGHGVIVTHLSPMSSSARLLEAQALTAIIRKDRRPVLVLGDFNTLSPVDTLEKSTIATLQSTSRLREKFLVDDGTAPDFSTMKHILRTLVDLGDPTDISVPTDLKVDQMHAAPMRLDFALATPSFASLSGVYSQMYARTVNDATTVRLSDHLPLVVQSSNDTPVEL